VLATAPIGEQVVAKQVFEQARRFVVAGERHDFRSGDRRRYRAQHQHALVFRSCAVEDLAREIRKDRVLALAQRFVKRGPAPAEVLAEQHERGHPAVAFPMDTRKLLGVDALAAEDGPRFVLRAAELGLVDARDAPAREEPRELGRGIGARDHHDRDPFGHLFECLRERRALLGSRVGLVEVVEDGDARVRQQREEVAEEAADESREILLRLRDEMRQRRRRLARELLRGDAEVMHEGRRIGIAGVVLVPEVPQAARLEPARDERGLAGAWRGAHPDDRSRRRFVEKRE
jgi:hypothetical protein